MKRIVTGAINFSGQVCISVQRLYVHEGIWDESMERFVPAARTLAVGGLLDASADLGPMVDLAAAECTERWVLEADAEGARVLLDGRANWPWFPSTVIADAPAHGPAHAHDRHPIGW